MPEPLKTRSRNAADVPEGYRMTELGPLPKEWNTVPFKEAILQKRVDVGKVKQKDYKQTGAFPIVDQGQALVGGYWNNEKHVYGGPLPVIIFGDHTRIFKYIDFPFVLGADGAKILLPNTNKFDPLFLFYALKQTNIPNRGYNRHYKYLKESNVPLPPLPEQRAIAYVLRAVQEAKEATEQVIAAARELKKSLMQHLFTYGPVPLGERDRVRLQETEIGPIPGHWRVVRLGDTASLRKGSVHPAKVPHARYVGLEHLIPGEIRIKQFGRADATRSAKSVFEKGDILYGKLRPYLDKAALAEWPGVCSTDILVLQPSEDCVPLYLAYLMHSSFILNHAIATTTGVNHPRTSWKALSQALVPLPPLPEQREIARILQAVDKKIETEENRKAALEALFKSLLRDLMTARRRLPPEFIARFARESK